MVQYFENLFTTTTTTAEMLTPREVVNRATQEQNTRLMQDVTYEEVKAATFSMHPEKSSGLEMA